MKHPEQTAKQPVASPCTGICVLDPATQLCEGCQRNVGEITDWINYTDAQKRAVIEQLPGRAGAPPASLPVDRDSVSQTQ